MAIDTDLVRILVGDNDSSSQLLSDDEIIAIVDGYTSDRLAAAAVADAIAAKFSRKVSFSLEGLRFENSTKAEAYLKLANRLRLEAMTIDGGGSDSVGADVSGVSNAEMDVVDSNLDRPGIIFKVGQQQ